MEPSSSQGSPERPAHLLIFGASVRAAAWSALRAGLRPWCVDLFADADLQACCPSHRLPLGNYPGGFLQAAKQGPPGPWMYTGALENRPALVQQIARGRPLWGNDAPVLSRVRSPLALSRLLTSAEVPCPAVRLHPPPPGEERPWLVKPRRGAGGSGIHFWAGEPSGEGLPGGVYFQEYIEGEPCAALFASDGRQARLLGCSRQLIGDLRLHARPFHYCGSLGPMLMTPSLRHALENLGRTLVAGSGLRGLFGVDFILREQIPWPVEVNPRYTAAVEVLEAVLGLPALAFHQQAFEPGASSPPLPSEIPSSPILGKAILFARAPLTFPDDGPWAAALRRPALPEDIPTFADIPHAGQPVALGRPILTLFARAADPAGCLDTLHQMALDLDRWLFDQ